MNRTCSYFSYDKVLVILNIALGKAQPKTMGLKYRDSRKSG